MDKYKIKEGLMDYRLRKNLTLEEMSKRLSMPEEVYAAYESEEPPIPDLDTLCRMARVTNKSVDYLLFGKKAVEDKALQKLPKDFQMLCEMYRHLDGPNTEHMQFMYRFLKFLQEEQNKKNETD